MIALLAAGFWLLNFLSTDQTDRSEIKENYPDIGLITMARERFLASLSGVSEDAEALVAGLTIGERSLISEDLEVMMRDLSLTHLVAVSGANLAIVMGVVYLLAAALSLPRNLRFAVALAVMAVYVLLVGPESSVIRAAVMATMVAIGLWLGKGSPPINALGLAVLILLAVDPALARDFGFALSVLATAGLLILAPVWYEALATHMPRWLAAGIAATTAAQLYTLPVLLLLQPSLPLYSVLANLLVEPAVAPITILGILAVMAATAMPTIAGPIGFLASVPAAWVELIAIQLGQLPMRRLHFVSGVSGVLLVGVITALVTAIFLPKLSRYRKPLGGALLVTIALAASWSLTDVVRFQTFAGNWQILACDVGQGDAVLIRSAGRVALIDVGNDRAKLSECLRAAGVEQIDLLVLTHFDIDHVGAVQEVAAMTSLALVSGFEDDRPAVERVRSSLDSSNVQIETGYRGLAGNLGDARWLILSPSKSAKEAKDSNDASLVVLIDLGQLQFLGLGDLGEAGQQRLLREHPGLLNQLASRVLVTKVAHHGSKDQSKDFMVQLRSDVALISVGPNDYGHPTQAALQIATQSGAKILRTDQHGSVAVSWERDEIAIASAGKLTG